MVTIRDWLLWPTAIWPTLLWGFVIKLYCLLAEAHVSTTMLLFPMFRESNLHYTTTPHNWLYNGMLNRYRLLLNHGICTPAVFTVGRCVWCVEGWSFFRERESRASQVVVAWNKRGCSRCHLEERAAYHASQRRTCWQRHLLRIWKCKICWLR